MTPVRHRRSALLVAVATLAVVVLAACSTSGRELRDTTMTPLPAAGGSPSTTGASSVSLIEALGGFALTSPEFVAGGSLPQDVGRDAANRSPALQWTSTPEDAAELALVAADATGANVYWLVTGLPTTDIIVAPGAAPLDGIVQANSAGRNAWDGPVAETGASVPVVFQLYALDQPLTIEPGLDPTQIVQRIASLSFARASLSANYIGADRPQMS